MVSAENLTKSCPISSGFLALNRNECSGLTGRGVVAGGAEDGIEWRVGVCFCSEYAEVLRLLHIIKSDKETQICMVYSISILIIMAQPQRPADVHQDELCPPNKRYALMDTNKKVDFENPFSIAASSSVPWIYIGQFWHTLHKDGSKYKLKFMLDRKELTLTLDDFRTIFHLPQATDNNHDHFGPAPTFSEMVPFYINNLGFTLELRSASNFKTTGLLQPWQTLCKMFSRCLTTRVTGYDQPSLQIMQMLYCFVNNIHVDYAELLWEGFHYSLQNPTTMIPYPRFTKLIVSHYMTAYPKISRRARDRYHNLADDVMIKSIFNSGKSKGIIRMKIPDWMITDQKKLTENYRLYAEVFGVDVPMTQSQPNQSTQGTHMTTSAPRSPNPVVAEGESSAPRKSNVIRLCIPPRRSTRLTPPTPIPTTDEADDMVLQDTIQVSLAEQKNHEEDEARENLEKVKEHLMAEEIENLVEGSENVDENAEFDSSPLRNDDNQSDPGTRLEPRSDKENPKVEITVVVPPVNVNDEKEESTEDDYELRRREKGKHVEEIRNTPSPTIIRSPRIQTNLVSSNIEELQELTECENLCSEISSQVNDAIANHIPSRVDSSVRNLLKLHQFKFENFNISSIPCRPFVIHPRDQDDPHDDAHPERDNSAKRSIPQLQQTDLPIWIALKYKFERFNVFSTPCRPSAVRPRDQDDPHDDAHPEGENSAKRQKTSEHGTFELGGSSSGQDYESEPGHEHKFITEIVAKRANGSIVSITESDYKNLNKNDIEDMCLLIINHKLDDYAETGLLWSLSVFIKILEGLKSYNNDVKHGYVTPSLSHEDAEYLQLFEEEIEERLKHRDQMRRWEILYIKAYDCEPSVELFHGFFNLCKDGSWLTFQKRSEKHILSLLAKVITRIEGWHQRFFFIQDTIVPSKFPQLLLKGNMLYVKSFNNKLPSSIEKNPQFQRLGRYPVSAHMSFRNFIYTEEDEDLTFLPKDFSLGFNTGSPYVSINTEPIRTDEEPAVEPAIEPTIEPVNERVGITTDLGGSPKGDTIVVYPGSVAARIRKRKCKIRGGSSRPLVKRKLASGSSTSHTIHAKDSAMKDDTPVLSIYDDDEGLEECLELKDATACHLKISTITPPAWKGFLDNHLNVDLLDLYNRCYARQAVVNNAVNKISRELLEVIEKLRDEADVLRARELACEEECEGIQAKYEADMTGFDKNPAVLLLREKMSSLAS
ncbi:hypothetical protein Tco_0586461 [Tanacetum coccineum]